MKRWYVVHTHARAEAMAREHLERQGFETYLPCYLRRRRHARRVEEVPAPLFPRYMFVTFDPGRVAWRPILSTIGVSNLLSEGERPLPVPEGVVEEIAAQENDDGLVSMAREEPYRRGDMVRVTGGPMGGLIGLFDGLSDRERVWVLLDLLGRQLRVKVPDAAVAAWS